MDRIESYYLYFTKGLDREERFKFYVDIHEKILYKDDRWHYFTEGKYDELRFSSKYKKKIDSFINDEENKRLDKYYEKENGWDDDQDIVEEYKNYFTEIFHQNTLMSLKLYIEREEVTIKKLEQIMDRVVHSFFNMSALYSNDIMLETTVMKDYLVNRAFYSGYLLGMINIKEEKSNDS
jgi:hypothetical protein